MAFDSIKKKINVKTLMSQSEALVENTETLNSGIKRLFEVLSDKKKISPEKLTDTDKKIKPTKEKEEKEKKKQGLKFPPLPGPGLLALGALAAAFAINPMTATKYLAKSLLKGLFRFIKRIGKIIKGIAETIGKLFKKIFTAIGDNVKKLKNFIDDKLLKPLREAFESAINSKWFKKLRSFFDDIVGSIKTFIKNSVERFKTFASDIFGKVKTFIDDFVNLAIDSFKGILNRIGDFVKTALESVRKTTTELGSELVERIVKPLKKKVIDELESAIKIVVKTIDNSLNNAQFLLNNFLPGKLGDKFIKPIRNALSGLKEEPVKVITKKFDDFAKNTKQLVGTGVDFAQDNFKSLTESVQAGLDLGKAFASDLKGKFDMGVQFVGDAGKQFNETLQSLNPTEQVKDGLNKLKEGISWAAEQARSGIMAPIEGPIKKAFGSSSKVVSNVIGGVGNTLKGLLPVIEGIKGVKDGIMKFVDKIPGIKGFKKGLKSATGRFDKLFTLAQAAISYGIRASGGVDTPIGSLQGQAPGNAILTALGGFIGAAAGSAIGTAIGTPLFGPLLGGAGSVLGGVIGEEAGKDISSRFSKMIPAENNKDPFIENSQIFESEKYNYNPFAAFFGSGEESEEQPQGGFNAGPIPRSTPINRDFGLMEEYTDDYDAEVVIIKQTEVVHNTKVIREKSSSQSPIIVMNSGESLLNNFKTRSLTQLSYS